jgi:hypothetical protein
MFDHGEIGKTELFARACVFSRRQKRQLLIAICGKLDLGLAIPHFFQGGFDFREIIVPDPGTEKTIGAGKLNNFRIKTQTLERTNP